jgi:hypothetical protein
MNTDIMLFHTIDLDNFIVKIYCINNTDLPYNLIEDFIQPIMDKINKEAYPRGIVERLESMPEFKKIEVYDKENNLLLDSTKFEA